MKDEVRILLLEDNACDAALIRHALKSGGMRFALDVVDSKREFVQELSNCPELILSDFSIPAFDGFEALQLAQERCREVPFIFITGTMGEELAVETLKKGATDCVLKHRLGRLVPAVERALRKARERVERQRTEEQLREAHEQSHALSVYLQYIREEERIRIAREIHDELGQSLTGLKLQLTWLSDHLPKGLDNLRDKTRSMMAGVDETIQTVQRIATELRPGVLDSAGLPAAIEWQARQFESQAGIPCRVTISVRDANWDQDLNTAFFRIFQETLTNIIRHASASAVEVRLFSNQRDLVLEIKDNGVGISEAEIHNTRSIGLLGMRERAGLLGGEVKWSGEAGKGTAVTVRIPRPGATYKRRRLVPA